MLIDEIGPLGGKLHTARSRNDQVATDMHLYLKGHTEHIIELITAFQHVLIEKAEEHVETILPGYTHLQRAQPISFAHHLLAYFWMLERDKERYHDSFKRINKSPLDAGRSLERHFRSTVNIQQVCSGLTRYMKTAWTASATGISSLNF